MMKIIVPGWISAELEKKNSMERKSDLSDPENKLPKEKEEDPDFRLKELEQTEEEPQVYKVARILKTAGPKDRREFMKNAAGFLGLVSLGSFLSGCEKESEINIQCDQGKCTCHVVCTCDTVNDGEASEHGSIWISNFNGQTCTCDTVCDCNTVCGCDTVCTCNSQGGGGGSYYYPN